MTTTRNKTAKTTRERVLPPVRVAEDERAQIKANAEAAGLPVSAYVRHMALHGRVTVTRQTDNAEALRLLLKAGNNLNQLAKSANQIGAVDIAALHDTLAELRAAADKVTR